MEPISITIVSEDDEGLAVRALTLADQAKGFHIVKQPDYEAAASFLRDTKALAKEITDFFLPLKKAAHDAHAKIVAAERDKLAPLAEAEKIVKNSMLAYTRRVEEEQRVANEAAREIAHREAEERQLAAAIAAEKRGDAAKAAEIISRPVLTIVPPPPVEIPKVAGIAKRSVWKANITNLMSFLSWVGENPIERAGFVKVDQTALDALARAMKGAAQIPGVTFFENEVLAAAASRAR